MKRVLALASVVEAVTGIMLIVYPSAVVRLLCGAEISDSGVVVSRIYGISLIAISVACWPSKISAQAFYGMLTYTTLTTVYLCAIARAGYVGILLWPAILFHAFLIVLLGGAWLRQRKAPAT